MKNRRITDMGLIALALLMSCTLSVAQAAEILIDSIILVRAMDVIAGKYSESAEIQQEINRLANSASSTFESFKRSNDALEALLVLNAGYRETISIQEDNIDALDVSIANVEV